MSHNVVHYDVSQAILERYLFCTFYSNGFGSWACAEVFRLNRTSWCLFPNLCLLYQAFPKIDQDSLYSFTRNLTFSKENHPPATFCASPSITVLNTPNRKTQEDIFIGKFRTDSCHSNEVNTLSKQDVN